MILRFTQGMSVVDIKCNVVHGSGFYDERLNQYSVRSVDASRNSYDLGPTVAVFNILAKNLSSTDKSALDSFIKNTIVFSKYSFSIAQLTDNLGALPTGIGPDFGNGPGATVTNVYYTKYDTKDVFTMSPPNVWDLNLTDLEFRR